MRIVLVSHRFPPDGITGVERYTQTLGAQLARDGHAVNIVSRGLGDVPAMPRSIRERLPDGVVLYRFQGGAAKLRSAVNQRLEQLFVMALVETFPDVVHINHLFGLTPRFVSLAHRYGAAVVLSLHDFYFACPLVHLQKPSGELCAGPEGGRECSRSCFAHEGPESELRWALRTAYYRRLLDSAERLICPSNYVASFFKRHGADAERIRVIPNAALVERDDTPQEGFVKTPDTLTLACMGAVTFHKGFHLVIQALRLAQMKSVQLRIFGVIGERDYPRRLLEEADAIPGLQLKMYGGYRSEELPFLLKDVDCVITPSQVAETFSITTREALLLGIPVLAARLGALPEAITEGINGFTFDHTSAGELAFLLKRLAADESLRTRLRAGARNTAILTLPKHAASVTAIYEEAIAAYQEGRFTPPSCREELEVLCNHLP